MQPMKKVLLSFVVSLFCIQAQTQAQMTTREVATGLFIPWELVYGPDNHIWFTQKNGYVCRLNPANGTVDTILHETEVAVQGEGGMLGLALHPDFVNTPDVFVAYNYLSGSTYKEKVVKYNYTSGALQHPVVLLDDIPAANIHNGCRLHIVTDKLFITTGDAANQPSAQDITSLSGKVLRINLDGSIPSDNPISGSPLWSWGHRNAQGLVWANNHLYISEHGPNNDDEINIVEKARNYGWPNVQGICDQPAEVTFCADSNVVEPIKAWTPTLAVSGMEYYNHAMFPQLKNALLMATLKNSRLHRLKLNGTYDEIDSADIVGISSFGRLRDVCIGPNGNIFISTSNSNSSGTNAIDKIIEIYDPSFVSVNNVLHDADITLYPNPVEHILIADMPGLKAGEGATYRLMTTAGKTVAEGDLRPGRNTISTADLAKGLYLVHILQNGQPITIKKISKL